MFDKTKEKLRSTVQRLQEIEQQRIEEEEIQEREAKVKLLSMSEKELLVEILMELKQIEKSIDDVKSTIRLYSD